MMTHKEWWKHEGSGIPPRKNEDFEQFAKRISRIAFEAADEARKDASAEIAEDFICGCGRAECVVLDMHADEIADSIRCAK